MVDDTRHKEHNLGKIHYYYLGPLGKNIHKLPQFNTKQNLFFVVKLVFLVQFRILEYNFGELIHEPFSLPALFK